MFYGNESRDSADVRQRVLPLRTTPSVAEQEGHLMEMVKPRKHLKITIIHLISKLAALPSS